MKRHWLSFRKNIINGLKKMSPIAEKLSFRKIFTFWAPLSATWLMMALEGPFLGAVIAHLADPKFNLAAYGAATAIAMIVESPILMILSAAITMVENKYTFLKMRNFTYALNAIITAIMLILLIPPVFDGLAFGLMKLPAEIGRLMYAGLVCLITWPAAIGFRRFYQGLLIKNNLTRRVAYGTVVRLLTMAAVAGFGSMFLKNVDGVIIGASGLAAGVLLESIATRFMAHSTIKKYMREELMIPAEKLTYPKIAKYYYPLALTSVIGMSVGPIATFFIGQGRMPVESLAVLPVIDSMIFVFRSFGMSYQEAAMALVGDKFEHYKQLRKFAFMIAGVTVFAVSILTFTPLSMFWFENIIGLSPELSQFAVIPARIMVVLPAFTAILSWQRSILLKSKTNVPVTISTFIDVSFTVLILLIGIFGMNSVGVVAAATALVLARTIATMYMYFPYTRELQRYGGETWLTRFSGLLPGKIAIRFRSF
jgi:hypothetical protein